jgi:AcrR family transcriptional regulator
MSRLELETIVDTAIGIADDGGLEAVTLRRVAARLGVTPMALYRHVEDKDGLLDQMADRLYAELAPAGVATDWWDGIAELARSTRRVLLAHPWAAPLFARPLAGPSSHAVDELLRASLMQGGFSAAEARELHDQLSNMVFALIAPELRGKRNRAAFERGLELLRAGLEARSAAVPRRADRAPRRR